MNLFVEKLLEKRPELSIAAEGIEQAIDTIVQCFNNGGKLLICGNGGSCADADHIAGEFLKSYLIPRPLKKELAAVFEKSKHPDGDFLAQSLQEGLPVISLCAHSAAVSAIMNDISADVIFAQQVMAYGRKEDVLLAISTSGMARNVILAAVTARNLGMTAIGLTGRDGGKFPEECDIVIQVPADITPDIQEYHVAIYHALCGAIEERIFG